MSTDELYTVGTTDGQTAPSEDVNIPDGNEFVFAGMDGKFKLVTDSPEDQRILLAWITAQTGKSIDELTTKDMMELAGAGGYTQQMTKDENGHAEFHIRVSPQVMNKAHAWSAGYYNSSPPLLTANTDGFVGAEIDLSQTDPNGMLSNAAAAAGFVGTAQKLYTDNYEDNVQDELNIDAIQDPELRELLVKVFGDPPGGFTVGHLNVLKVMNLAEGDGTGAVGNWTISPSGQVVSNALDQEGTDFVADGNLFTFQDPKYQNKILAGDAYFDPDTGQWINASPEMVHSAVTDLKKNYQDLHDALLHDNGAPAELPPGMTLPDDVTALLQQLSGKSGGFNAADLNVAIAMGFVSYDRNTGAVTLTPRGQTMLTAMKPEAPPAEQPTDNSAANDEAFWHATNTVTHAHGGAGLILLDYMEGEHVGKGGGLATDKRFYGYFATDNIGPMLEGDQPILNENSEIWEEAGLGHLTMEQRKEVLGALKIWAQNREKLDTVSGFDGTEGKEGRVINDGEAARWLARNAGSWISAPTQRAQSMLSMGIQPDSGWVPYDMNSDVVTPYKEKLGQVMKNVLGLDIGNMTQEQFNQALYILETTGYIKMPGAEDTTKLIRLTDMGTAALATQPPATETAEAA